MTALRRLDHVAVAVEDTERALGYFRDRLGLEVASTEVIEVPHVRLTYLDAGSIFIQLVEPLDGDSPIAAHLAEHGEGLHHIAFGVEDVPAVAAALAGSGAPPVTVGSGRGRPSAFVPGEIHHGVRVEVTGFDHDADVRDRPGELPEPERSEDLPLILRGTHRRLSSLVAGGPPRGPSRRRQRAGQSS